MTILFFIGTANLEHGPIFIFLSRLIGLLILLDLLARLWVSENWRQMLTRIYTIADMLVVISLFLEPFLEGNLAFLRILRGLRLIHSYHLLQDLRRDSRYFREHEEAVIAGINLFVFVMVTATTALVFFMDVDASQSPYIDAIYFTMATLTTTGYGDLTMTTPGGKVFSIVVMIVGVTLFVRLAQALMSPKKVNFKCEVCGLLKHDIDAVHCKHCGDGLQIETDGVNLASTCTNRSEGEKGDNLAHLLRCAQNITGLPADLELGQQGKPGRRCCQDQRQKYGFCKSQHQRRYDQCHATPEQG